MSTVLPQYGKSLGQVAYEAYAVKVGNKSVKGDTLPSWDDQKPEIKAAWDAAGQAVGDMVINNRTRNYNVTV